MQQEKMRHMTSHTKRQIQLAPLLLALRLQKKHLGSLTGTELTKYMSQLFYDTMPIIASLQPRHFKTHNKAVFKEGWLTCLQYFFADFSRWYKAKRTPWMYILAPEGLKPSPLETQTGPRKGVMEFCWHFSSRGTVRENKGNKFFWPNWNTLTEHSPNTRANS